MLSILKWLGAGLTLAVFCLPIYALAPTYAPVVLGTAPGFIPPGRYSPLVTLAQPETNPTNNASQINSLLGVASAALSAGLGQPDPETTNFSTYQYPDDYRFSSGASGEKNILNGLCAKQGSKTPTQMANGDCTLLERVVTSDNSCAHKALNEIMTAAGSDGRGVGGLNDYCPTFSQMTSGVQKEMVIVQTLAALITQESGWKATNPETPWVRNDGKVMAGKGLFQIGVDDGKKSEFPDCQGLNDQNINDPETNIRCGACIALTSLAKDNQMGGGVGDDHSTGMARYFGPMRDAQARKRDVIKASVKSWCMSNVNSSSGGENPGAAH